MAEPIDGGDAQHPVGREDVSPFTEVQIAGHHGDHLFVSNADEIVDILVVGWPHGLEAEDVDDERGDLGQLPEDPLVGAGGTRGMKTSRDGALARKTDIHLLADGAMPQRLGQMALAGTAQGPTMRTGAFSRK